MPTNDLKWVIENGTDEVDYYLEQVTTTQFIEDVKELIKKNQDKSAIQDAIKRLQEML